MSCFEERMIKPLTRFKMTSPLSSALHMWLTKRVYVILLCEFIYILYCSRAKKNINTVIVLPKTETVVPGAKSVLDGALSFVAGSGRGAQLR